MKKNNYSYVGISFIILLFGIIFIPKIVDRVKNNDIVRDAGRSEAVSNNASIEKEAYVSDLEFITINGKRKRVPEFSFTNQDGKTINNQDYKGKVHVVEFFFTTCPTICPRMNKNLVEVQEQFKDKANFGIASFSITPEIDTPQVLKAYAENYGIDSPNWHLMTGEEAKIYNLANVGFNIYVGRNEEIDPGFEHSGDFALIDKNGYIRSRKDAFGNPKIFYKGIISVKEKMDEDGNEEEITMLKEDIAKLLKE